MRFLGEHLIYVAHQSCARYKKIIHGVGFDPRWPVEVIKKIYIDSVPWLTSLIILETYFAEEEKFH